MPLGAAHAASSGDKMRSERSKGSGENFYSTGFGGSPKLLLKNRIEDAWKSCRLPRLAGLILSGRNCLQPCARVIAFVQVKRSSLPLVALEEFRIVVGFAIHAFPSEERVVAGRQAAQGEASALITDRGTIALGTAAPARFGHGDHYRVGNGFVLLIDGHALGDRTIAARYQI